MRCPILNFWACANISRFLFKSFDLTTHHLQYVLKKCVLRRLWACDKRRLFSAKSLDLSVQDAQHLLRRRVLRSVWALLRTSRLLPKSSVTSLKLIKALKRLLCLLKLKARSFKDRPITLCFEKDWKPSTDRLIRWKL
mmetsp:Transcript_26892/g.43907  ORF Transcript_26892/g.43907 Transcript_26892/m.43907 type:complete len:138 (+) Transcript_26892:4459-4872(+)